jgi:hypothetical protein
MFELADKKIPVNGLDFRGAGLLISIRSKGVCLSGAPAGKIRAGQGRFTPCTRVGSLLEAMTEAAKCWILGDTVLLSLACSSSNQLRNEQNCREAVCQTTKSIGGGATSGNPNINDINNDDLMRKADRRRNHEFVSRFCEGKPRSKNNATQTSMKGRDQRQENE